MLKVKGQLDVSAGKSVYHQTDSLKVYQNTKCVPPLPHTRAALTAFQGD